MTNSVAIMLFTAFLTGVSQVLLKVSADRPHATRWREFLNGYVITAYTLFVICVLLNIVAFQGLTLKAGPVLASASYVFVLLLSALILRERITPRQLLGNLLVITGIIVFNL